MQVETQLFESLKLIQTTVPLVKHPKKLDVFKRQLRNFKSCFYSRVPTGLWMIHRRVVNAALKLVGNFPQKSLEFWEEIGLAGSARRGDFCQRIFVLIKLQHCCGCVDCSKNKHGLRVHRKVSVLHAHSNQKQTEFINLSESDIVLGRCRRSQESLPHYAHVRLVEIVGRHEVELEFEQPEELFFALENGLLAKSVVRNLLCYDTRM